MKSRPLIYFATLITCLNIVEVSIVAKVEKYGNRWYKTPEVSNQTD